MSLIISHHFNDLNDWDVTKVLKVFKEELSAREKTFSTEPDNANYIASSLFIVNDKFKKNSDIFMFVLQKKSLKLKIESSYAYRNQEKYYFR